MPIYTYKCSICDKVTDSYNTISGMNDCPECECGRETEKIIVPVNIAPVLGGGDFQGYLCPVSDQWVTPRKKRQYITESNNLVEVGDRKPSKKRIDQTERNIANGII